MQILNQLETEPIPIEEEEKRHGRRLLIGLLCALLLTGTVLGGYSPAPSSSAASGRATYFSANNTTSTGFYCSTPSNSKHAQKIQKLCTIVQEQPPPPPHPKIGSGHYTPSAMGRVVAVVESPDNEVVYERPPPLREEVAGTVVLGRETPKVYRYEDAGQLAYHCKSERGEVYVSAPQGSGEARTFEGIARRMAGGQRKVC